MASCHIIFLYGGRCVSYVHRVNFTALIGNGRGFLLVVMMEQQDTELKNDVKYQGKLQDPDVEDYRPESIARCVLRFQNRKMDGISMRNGLPRLGWLEAAHKMR